MLGMSRTVAGGATKEYEFLRISTEKDGLVFTARPSGQEEAAFRSVRVTGSGVVFENPGHDFPQRIAYERRTDGSLLAWIEGAQGGKSKKVEYPMLRAACAGDRSR